MHPLITHATAWCHGSAGIGIGTVGMRGVSTRESLLVQRIERAAKFTRAAFARDDADDGLCHGASGRALALVVMNAMPRDVIAEKLASTRPMFAADDHSLMTGGLGRTVTRLVLGGLAPVPLAVTLTDLGGPCTLNGSLSTPERPRPASE
jgi:hypothetical protein